MQGYIVKGMGGLYTVRDAQGTAYVLRAKKKFRRERMTPLVGDRVSFTPGAGEEHGWVEEILPRTSVCLRPPVANVELLLLVIAPTPAPDLLLLDKLLQRANRQGIAAAIVVNKSDLDAQVAEVIGAQYRASGAPVFAVSARAGTGLAPLREAMRGSVTCLAGQSGVGKSTLLNALFGWRLKTGEISAKIARGRHTTRHAELLEADGLRVLDTPGFSLLEGEENFEPVRLQEDYSEFAPYAGKCRFAPCYHDSEPGCAVVAAAVAGEIHPERLERYHTLLREARQRWRERYD